MGVPRRRKKRFECSHYGFGRYCHRCEQEGVGEKQRPVGWPGGASTLKQQVAQHDAAAAPAAPAATE